PAISGEAARAARAPLDRAAYIRQTYLGVSPEHEAEMWRLIPEHDAGQIADDAVQAEIKAFRATKDQSERLSDYLGNLDPQYAEKGLPLFGNHPIEDSAQRMLAGSRAVAGADAVHDLLAKNATLVEHAPA